MNAHLSRFSESARRVLASAHREAVTLGHARIRPEHILLAIFEEGGAAGKILAGQGVNYETFRRIVEAETPETGQPTATPGKIDLDESTKRLLEGVVEKAGRKITNLIDTEDVLSVLATLEDAHLITVMEKADLDRGRIQASIDRFVGTPEGLSDLEGLLETLDACRLVFDPDSVHQERLRAIEGILRGYFSR